MSNSNSTKQTLEQNYNALLSDRRQIKKLEKEYITLNATDKDTQLVITEYYSKYIVLIFVTILLVLLLLKYAITGSEQVGGGHSNFANDAIFLILIMIIFITLAHTLNNLHF